MPPFERDNRHAQAVAFVERAQRLAEVARRWAQLADAVLRAEGQLVEHQRRGEHIGEPLPGLDVPPPLPVAALRTALDVARCDAAARAEGVGLASRLGGDAAARIPLYANINRRTRDRSPAGFGASAAHAIARGFQAVKIAPFDEVGPALRDDVQGRKALDAGIARIAAVREALGPDRRLMVDCHWRFGEALSARLVEAIRPFGLYWLECPVVEEPRQIPALAAMRKTLNARATLLSGLEEFTGAPAFLAYADAYDVMNAAAENSPPGAQGLLFLPYLVGERTPHMDPNARGAFWGLTLRHGQADLVRAVLEGVTCACYDAFLVLESLGGAPAEVILAGGGARSLLWQQIVADVFGRPVRPLQTSEQSALGALLLAGAGIGLFDLAAAARDRASYGAVVAPDPAQHEFYSEQFSAFRDLYRRNVGHFGQEYRRTQVAFVT